MSIGEKIKHLRESKKLSQRAMAKDLNITNPTISMWENGIRNPDTQTLVLLSKYFTVPVSYFFEEQNEIKKVESLEPYQKKFIEYVKTMNDNECMQAKAYIETLRKMQTDKEQSEELFNILKKSN